MLISIPGLAAGSCSFSYSTDKSYQIVVDGELPLQAKTRIAQAMASPESARRLGAAVRSRFPNAASASIEHLRLEWRVIHFVAGQPAGTDAVYVIVHVPVAGDEKKAAEIRDYCEQILRTDLAGRKAKELSPPNVQG